MSLSEPTAPTAIQTLVQQLLDEIEGLDPDRLSAAVDDRTVQKLVTVAVRIYASKLEDEVVLFPFVDDETLTATEVGMTVGHMIKAADIDLFELVSWQSLRGN
jgi:hypothetical protein